MSSIKAFVRTKVSDKIVNVRFRVSHGENIQLFYTSKIEVRADAFDSKKEQIKGNTTWVCDRIKLNKEIFDTKNRIYKVLSELNDNQLRTLSSEQFSNLINGNDEEQQVISIHDRIKEYCILRRLSVGRTKHFVCVSELLKRYETLHGLVITEDMICYELMMKIDNHARMEHELYNTHPDLWSSKGRTKPSMRSENTIASIMNIVRAIFNYLFESGYITDRSYTKYKISAEVYGTPYYLTAEELKQIREADLSKRPALECQRDIFLFQCLVGCRVSDLMQFTSKNIIENRFLEYVQSKSNRKVGDTIRVPLTSVAISLIKKYKSNGTGKLFPYIEPQKYNVAIKRLLTTCKVMRIVTILDPKTRKEKQVPINEIASSHLARRTFTGLVYKNVKDPNIVGKMTGHAEGSRAISRYRTIDDDIKREAIAPLDIL